MHTRFVSAVLSGLLLATLLPLVPAGAAPTRVLLVGDSITEGTGGDTAYRCDLWDLLPPGSVDFVGQQGPDGTCGVAGFDADHDGVGGATTAQRVDGGAWNLNYDVALVHLGTNDKNGVNFSWTQSYIDNTLKPSYRELIDKVRLNNPNVTIYLGQIIPCGFGPDGMGFLGCDVTHNGGLDNNGDPVQGINQAWADVAAEKNTAQSPIILVDHRVGFDANNDLKPDQVHPDASGRAKMAAKWAAALADQLPVDEVLLVEPNGRWHIRRPGMADYTFFYGVPGDVPIFGDWNGDGVATPGAYRAGPGGGFAYLTNTLPPNGGVGVADFDYFFGAPGDEVLVGDWDGNGSDTLGVNRDGHIFLANVHGSGGQPVPTARDFWFGAPGDRAVGADTNSNGTDGLIVYRPGTGFSFFLHTIPSVNGQAVVADGTYFFGVPSDRFVAGDWNGDGRDTAGVFRPSNTTVYLTNDLPAGGGPAGTADSYGWGSASWIPVAGDWD